MAETPLRLKHNQGLSCSRAASLSHCPRAPPGPRPPHHPCSPHRMAPLGRQSKDGGPGALGRDTPPHNGPNSLILAGEWAQATHQPIRRVFVWEKNDLFNLRQPLCAAETTLQSTSLNKAKGEGPQFLDSHRKPSRTWLESVELGTHGEDGGQCTAQGEALGPHPPAHRPHELTWPACLIWGSTDRQNASGIQDTGTGLNPPGSGDDKALPFSPHPPPSTLPPLHAPPLPLSFHRFSILPTPPSAAVQSSASPSPFLLLHSPQVPHPQTLTSPSTSATRPPPTPASCQPPPPPPPLCFLHFLLFLSQLLCPIHTPPSISILLYSSVLCLHLPSISSPASSLPSFVLSSGSGVEALRLLTGTWAPLAAAHSLLGAPKALQILAVVQYWGFSITSARKAGVTHPGASVPKESRRDEMMLLPIRPLAARDVFP